MVGLLIIVGDELTPTIFNRSYRGLKLATSGLTICSFENGLWSDGGVVYCVVLFFLREVFVFGCFAISYFGDSSMDSVFC